MKNANLLLSTLALVGLMGAGCTATTSTSTTAESTTESTTINAEADAELNADGETTTDTNTKTNTTSDASATTTTDVAITTPIIEADTSAVVTVALNVSMESGNFFFKPNTISAKAGQTVNITFSGNEGYHTIVIDEIDFKKTVAASETITFTAPSKPGSYPFICDVGKHAAMGMTGTLIVE